jgi:hypothetical protein
VHDGAAAVQLQALRPLQCTEGGVGVHGQSRTRDDDAPPAVWPAGRGAARSRQRLGSPSACP